MGMRKIKVGDEVQVMVGKDNGKTGTIIDLLDNDRAVVSGVNVRVHHKAGGIITKEGSIHISNILPYSAKLKKGCRVGFSIKDGNKLRVLKQSGEVLAEKYSQKTAKAQKIAKAKE